MDIGMTYPITVAITFDELLNLECCIWVDWNQDLDFDDVEEEIAASTTPYTIAPFRANITPPAGAVLGDTRMRVRVIRDETPGPCGNAFYGEVEDYTITVTDNNGCGETQYAGGCGTEDNPYLIYTAEHLQAIGGSPWTWDRYFKLMADVDMSGYTGEQFNIIGTGYIIYSPFDPPIVVGTPFTGVFDGNGHTISNFSYNSTGSNHTGLFGTVYGDDAEIWYLGLKDANIDAGTGYRIGLLSGNLHGGTIGYCYAEGGSITGTYIIGGLVGYKYGGTVGGCYSTCSVLGDSEVGGLVGRNHYGSVYISYALGSVSGSDTIGGLVGLNDGGNIYNSYAKGSVFGDNLIGGLVGHNGGNIGGCYSVGSVTGNTNVGGLVGETDSWVSASFWDVNSSGLEISDGGAPKTTAEMQTKSTFTDAGWDFVNTWDICEGTNYPKLVWQIPLAGDFNWPDGVGMEDLAVVCEQWLLEELSADVWPDGGDGVVDFLDWAIFADGWQITNDFDDLSVFVDQWLQTGANYYIADIAPAPDGDGIVNMLDLAAQANNWLAGPE